MKYMITAKARWTESYEHPRGKRPSIDNEVCRTLSRGFEAANLRYARLRAKRFLADFKKGLPIARKGGLVWSSSPRIMSVVFVQIRYL